MRKHFPFLGYLAVLSLLSGWLLSKMSWIGRVGINLLHKEYKFLKVWYKGAGFVFAILLVLFFMHQLAQQRLAPAKARIVHVIAILLALCGLLYTYLDFRGDFSHKLLREPFHLGAYLFWIGWISVSIYFLGKTPQTNVQSKM